jgi:hypothetical protein
LKTSPQNGAFGSAFLVITAGGALLGWIGGGMMVSDPALPPDLFAALHVFLTADVCAACGS